MANTLRETENCVFILVDGQKLYDLDLKNQNIYKAKCKTRLNLETAVLANYGIFSEHGFLH